MPYFCDNHMYPVDPDLKDFLKTVDCHMPQQIKLIWLQLICLWRENLKIISGAPTTINR